MTWALLPTALWALAMLMGLVVSLKILQQMIGRRRVQRKWRPDDALLAEIADRNVVTEWLRAGGFACMAIAGVAAVSMQVVAGYPTPALSRWHVAAFIVAGGMFFVAGAIRDDNHARRVLRLALDGMGGKEAR